MSSDSVRAWLGSHRHGIYTALVLGAAYVVVYASMYRLRPLYAPDTRYYAAMALWFSGTDQATAAELVREYTTATGGWKTPGADVLFGWGLVQPRVVYPLLSVPFVKAFGIDGMLVVPAMATAVLVGLLAWMLGRRYGVVSALTVALLLLSSGQFIFFGIAMLTESLSALWCALILLVCWRYQRDHAWRWVGVLVALTLLMAFTRQSTLIPAGALAAAWLAALVLRDRPTRWAKPALAVGVTTVLAQVVQTLAFPFSQTNQFLRATDTTSLDDAIGAAPGLALTILKSDLKHYMASDRCDPHLPRPERDSRGVALAALRVAPAGRCATGHCDLQPHERHTDGLPVRDARGRVLRRRDGGPRRPDSAPRRRRWTRHGRGRGVGRPAYR